MFTLRSARQSAPFIRQHFASPPPRVALAGRRSAHQDYGSGAVKPGEPNPAVDQEHPGPPPPKVAQKQSQGSQSESQASKSESSESKKDGPQPKILSDNPPAQGKESEDVARHNEEMQKRADRPAEGVKNEDAEKDKVSKGFWAGQGGRDKDP